MHYLKLAQAARGHSEQSEQSVAELQSQSVGFLPTTRPKLLQQLASATPRTLPAPDTTFYVVPQPGRRPCGVAFKDLQPVSCPAEHLVAAFQLTLSQMAFADLRAGVQHKGKFVLARRIGKPAVGYQTFSAGIEDEHGNVMLLTMDVYNFPGKDLLPPNSIIAIKEPHYTMTPSHDDLVDICILVEHASDVLLLQPTDSRVPGPFGTNVLDPNKHALRCKEDGNRALINSELASALNSYSEGLSVSADIGLTKDIHRNRALVLLRLHRYDAAIQDALASLSSGTGAKANDLDHKAYYRAGLSAYELGRFEQARDHFEASLRLKPGDKDCIRQLARSAARVSEQSGTYDFGQIIEQLSPSKPRVDAANYVQRVEVQNHTECGRGLFSTQHIRFGALILCEKALCVVYANDPGAHQTLPVQKKRVQVDRVSEGAPYRMVLKKLVDNPSLIPKVLELYAGEQQFAKHEPIPCVVDGMPLLDSFQVHEIFHYNSFHSSVMANPDTEAFPFSTTSEGTTGHGLWALASFINHSCVPNAHRCFFGDLMVVRATKEIVPGEEITISYDTPADYGSEDDLGESWGFKCKCPLCTAEKSAKSKAKQKRSNYLSQARSKAGQWEKRSVIVDIRNLVRETNQTYESTYPKGLPRRALEYMHSQLSRMHGHKGNFRDAADSAIEQLRCYGVGVDVKGDTLVVDRKFSMSSRNIVSLLIQISNYKGAAGQPRIAAEFEKLAREVYMMHNGSMHGYEVAKTDDEIYFD